MPRDLCRPGFQRQLLQNWKTVLMWSYCWGLSFYFASLQGLRGEMSKRLQCGVGMLPKATLNNFLVYSLSLVNAACYSKPKVCNDSWSKKLQKLRTFFLGIGSTLTNLWIHKCVSHSYSCFRYHLILLWVFVLLKRIICWFNTTTSNVKKNWGWFISLVFKVGNLVIILYSISWVILWIELHAAMYYKQKCILSLSHTHTSVFLTYLSVLSALVHS